MRVQLNHNNHTYTDQKRQPYKAVSSIIAQYKKPFNAYELQKNGKTLISNYVDKHGGTEEEWLNKWEDIKEYACRKGTAFHNLKEMYVNNQAVQVISKQEMPVRNLELLWQFPDHEGMFHLLPPGVYTEMTLWNYQHRIAGTPDVTTIFPTKEFDIDDYKTNGKFRVEAFMGKTMKWPFINLQDCELGHYTLQLSLYAWMLEQFGLRARSLRLHHYSIPDEEVKKILEQGILPDIEPTIHEVPYVKKEVESIMKQRLTELKNTRHYAVIRR